jgi:hypothetical protein
MTSRKSISLILGLSLFVFIIGGSISCQKKAEPAKGQEAAAPVKTSEYEGTAKVAQGKYLYLPPAQGLDIVVQGKVGSGDASTLIGKEIRVKGQIAKDETSIYVADSIEVKEAGQWRVAFTRTEEPVLSDHLDLKERDGFQAFAITNLNKNDEWEGKGKSKIYGKLLKATVTENGGQKEVSYIVLSDDKGKEIGRIIIDNISDYAQYYLLKLRLFDKLWFYLNVKDTVDKKIRVKTKELFHADVLLAGLF